MKILLFCHAELVEAQNKRLPWKAGHSSKIKIKKDYYGI